MLWVLRGGMVANLLPSTVLSFQSSMRASFLFPFVLSMSRGRQVQGQRGQKKAAPCGKEQRSLKESCSFGPSSCFISAWSQSCSFLCLGLSGESLSGKDTIEKQSNQSIHFLSAGHGGCGWFASFLLLSLRLRPHGMSVFVFVVVFRSHKNRDLDPPSPPFFSFSFSFLLLAPRRLVVPT